MKEHKYKAWDKTNNKMRDVCEIGFDQYGNVMYVILTITFPTNNGDVDFDFVKRKSEEVVLLQYTGIKDKENNEVYEDDIVEGLVMVQNDLIAVRGLIKFIHGRFVIAEHNCSLYKFSNALGNESNEITKIGNKHENPELLNK